MIFFACSSVLVAAFAWPAVIRWSRQLDAAIWLDAYRPSAADVAKTERALPHMPFDPHYPLNSHDVEFLDAVDTYWEAKRSADER